MNFWTALFSTWWGILLIVLVCLSVWIALSVWLYKPVFKRFYDLTVSFVAILVLSPIFLALTAVGAVIMRGNPFFTQERPGRNEKIFRLIKFRTMTQAKNANGELLSDAERLTRYGRILRSTSLDELPELLNIFIGQMSFVGPRPLLVSYLPLYNNEQRRRHEVRPGLTGLAQVSGRNALDWQDKFRKDVEYVENITFAGDIRIFLKTFQKVFKREGISQNGEATMRPFEGNEEYAILILSAGRRVELVKCFAAARNRLHIAGSICAADAQADAPALQFADKKFIIPRIKDEHYLETLKSIVETEHIRLIIPTIDTELEILAKNKHIFPRDCLVMADKCCEICCDKSLFARFLAENEIPAPKTFTVDEALKAAKYPLFIKPAKGSSSINAFKVNNETELTFFAQYVEQPVIQEFLDGAEYTIDVLCDFDGNILCAVSRRRLAVRSGEILKGTVEKKPVVLAAAEDLVAKMQPSGMITVQGILQEDTFKILEVNPRFGGGAPMSIKAGADFCEMLYRLLRKEKVSRFYAYRETKFARYDESIEVG